jgi:CspA family cold shock protein
MAATADSISVDTRTARAHGTVRWFSHKGFGFIAGDNGQDVYVHHSAIVGSGFRTLPTGASVHFGVVSTVRGPEAVDVVGAADD